MSRTEFMPFAPFLTSENAKLFMKPYDENDKSLWFMTATVKVSEKFKKLCPAVTHVDGTARPQVVLKSKNDRPASRVIVQMGNKKWRTFFNKYELQ